MEDSDVVSEADTIPDALVAELPVSDSDDTVPDAAELPPLPPPAVPPPAPAPTAAVVSIPETPPAPDPRRLHDMNSLVSLAHPGTKPGILCDTCPEGEAVFRPGLYGRLFLGCTRYHADACHGRALGWRGVDFVPNSRPASGPGGQLVPVVPNMTSSLAPPGGSLTNAASSALSTVQQQVAVATPQDLQQDLLRGMTPQPPPLANGAGPELAAEGVPCQSKAREERGLVEIGFLVAAKRPFQACKADKLGTPSFGQEEENSAGHAELGKHTPHPRGDPLRQQGACCFN